MLLLPESHRRVLSIAYFFEIIGIVLGNWVARIPDVKTAHGLSDGMFGVILLCAIGGGLLSFPFISPLVHNYGSCKATIAGAIALSFLAPVIGFPYHQIWILALGLFGLGFGWGILDVSINTQATLYEKASNKHMMGFFHANFSLGGFFGSLIGGLMAQYNFTPFYSFVIISVVTLPFAVLFHFGLYNKEQEIQISEASAQQEEELESSKWKVEVNSDDENEQISVNNNDRVRPSLFTLLSPLCAIMLVASMIEGSVGDWSTIFMTASLHFSPFLAALGFAIFSLMLAIGRLSSDYIRNSINTSTLLGVSGFIGLIGFFSVALSPLTPSHTLRIVLAYIGLFVTGIGVSVSLPVITSVTSRIPGIDSTQAIATVTAFAYIGALIGPPLFGGLSYFLGGLQWALVVDASLFLVVIVCSLFLQPGTSGHHSFSVENNDYVTVEKTEKTDEMNNENLYHPLMSSS